LYYCIVYLAIQPLKAASVLNKISSVQFKSVPKIVINDTIIFFVLNCSQHFGNFKQ